MTKYYTGVGSRNTPQSILELINQISIKLSEKDYILRSGGADGADNAFYKHKPAKSEIYLPWKGFNGSNSDLYLDVLSNRLKAEELAKEIHPAWQYLSNGAKKLHTRNTYQVLGLNLDNPSKFLICWAEVDKHGIPKGGTRTAWILAKQYSIPCFNLFLEKDKERLEKFIQT